MPRHPFKKYTTGERLPGIPKEVLNAVVEQQRGFVPGGGQPLKNLIPNSTIVKVKNESGAWLGRYSILGLDGPLITPTQNEREFKREVTFSGITPTTASHTSKFCILLEPLADDAIGKAVVAGVSHVRLTGADVGFAAVTNNDATKLTASASGTAEVLYAEAGSSERWAIVDVRSRGVGGSYALASRSTSLTVANWVSNAAAVPLDTSVSTSGNASLVTESGLTGVIKITNSGLKRFRATANAGWTANATGMRTVQIWVWDHNPTFIQNASTLAVPACSGGFATNLCCSGDFLSPNDSVFYVELRAGQASGGNLDLFANARLSVQEIL